MEQKIFLQFRIEGEKIDFDKINACFGKASHTYRKGEVFKNKYSQNTAESDCWLGDYEIPDEQNLSEAIEQFIAPFYQNKDFLHKLAADNKVKFWLSVYMNDRYANIELPKKVIGMIFEMNIDLAVAITYLGDF